MKHKKHDILDEVKNFPKVKTSDNFLEDLHGKLDELIAEEKLSASLNKESFSKKKRSIREFFTGMISSRYIVPALGTLTLLFILYYYFLYNNDDKKQTAEDKNNDNLNKTEQLQFPPVTYPPVTGNTGTIDSPLVNPDKEIQKLITESKKVTGKGSKLIREIIKDKEKELRLLDPESIAKNFGFAGLTQSMNELKTLDLRSHTFNKEKLEILKAKIDSLSK